MSHFLKILSIAFFLIFQANASIDYQNPKYIIQNKLKKHDFCVKLSPATENQNRIPLINYHNLESDENIDRVIFKDSIGSKTLYVFFQINDVDYDEDSEEYIGNRYIYEGHKLFIFENVPCRMTLSRLQDLVGGKVISDIKGDLPYVIGKKDTNGELDIKILNSEHPIGELCLPDGSFDLLGYAENCGDSMDYTIDEFYSISDYAIKLLRTMSNAIKNFHEMNLLGRMYLIPETWEDAMLLETGPGIENLEKLIDFNNRILNMVYSEDTNVERRYSNSSIQPLPDLITYLKNH